MSGESAVLFTSRGYSINTAKHKGIARNAVNHKNLIYCYNPLGTSKQNFEEWIKETENTAACLVRAKKPEKYITELEGIEHQAKTYADFMCEEVPERLSIITSAKNSDEYRTYMEKKKSILETEAKKEAANRLKQFKLKLKKWESGEHTRMYDRSPDNVDFLRMKSTDEVETSQGVKIPKAVAQRFYARLSNGEVKEGDEFLKFSIKTVSDKEIVIGCHRYQMAYISKFVAKNF